MDIYLVEIIGLFLQEGVTIFKRDSSINHFALKGAILVKCFCTICILNCQSPEYHDVDLGGIWLGQGIHPVRAYENENYDSAPQETLWVDDSGYHITLRYSWIIVYEAGQIEQHADSLCFRGIHYSKYDTTAIKYSFPFYMSDNNDTMYGLFEQIGLFDYSPYFIRLE